MKRSHTLLLSAAIAVAIPACDGLKEAFTAHVDLVARAGGQELSTERLAGLMGNAQIPIQKDVAQVVADFWVNYQLLAYAGAHGDSLADGKLVEEAMWAPLADSKSRRFFETIVLPRYGSVDTAKLEQSYAQGEALAAQHILIMMPDWGQGMSDAKKDSIRNKAEGLRKRATAANFGDLAKQFSEDPGSKDRGGSYGAFPPGMMVPEFDAGVRALKPGEISPALVQTSYGFHIIRRHLLSEVRQEYSQALLSTQQQRAESLYFATLDTEQKVELKPEHVAKAREVGKSPQNFHDDKTVLASSRLGSFTASSLAKWIEAYGVRSNIAQALVAPGVPDSVVTQVVQFTHRRDMMLHDAEKAKIAPDSAEIAQVHSYFTSMVRTASMRLRVDPAALGDSARTTAEKERLAATRVEAALDELFATSGASLVDIPAPLAYALRKKYSYRVNVAGLDRAVERASLVRAALDSTKAREAPPTPPAAGGTGRGDVPPGAPPAAPPPTGSGKAPR